MKLVCILAILASLNLVKTIFVNNQAPAGQGWANGPADNGPGANNNNNAPANNYAPANNGGNADNGSAPQGADNGAQGWNVNQFGGIPSLDWPANWPRAQVSNKLADGAAGSAHGGIGGPYNNANNGQNGNAPKGQYDYLFDAAYNGALINLGIPAWYNPAFDNASSNGVPDSYGLNKFNDNNNGNNNAGNNGNNGNNAGNNGNNAGKNNGSAAQNPLFIIYKSKNGRFWRRRGDGKFEGWRGQNTPSANDVYSALWVVIYNADNANDNNAPSGWINWSFAGANGANNQGNNQFPANGNGQINWGGNNQAGQQWNNRPGAIINIGEPRY